jgi:hypothetical protein
MRNIGASAMSDKTNKPLDIEEEDVANFKTERELKSTPEEIDPDEAINLRARLEAARQHGDTFIVATDLQDDDQREGSREQP